MPVSSTPCSPVQLSAGGRRRKCFRSAVFSLQRRRRITQRPKYQFCRAHRQHCWSRECLGRHAPALTLPRPGQRRIHTISVHSQTIYLRRERLQDDIQKTAMFPQLGLRFADYGETPDVAITVDRPVMTFDWTYTMVYQPKSLTLASRNGGRHRRIRCGSQTGGRHRGTARCRLDAAPRRTR